MYLTYHIDFDILFLLKNTVVLSWKTFFLDHLMIVLPFIVLIFIKCNAVGSDTIKFIDRCLIVCLCLSVIFLLLKVTYILNLYMFIRTYIHTYIHNDSYFLGVIFLPLKVTYIHKCIHVYTYTYIHTYIHSYIHKFIHTYTNIHTYIHNESRLPSVHVFVLRGNSLFYEKKTSWKMLNPFPNDKF